MTYKNFLLTTASRTVIANVTAKAVKQLYQPNKKDQAL